MRECIDDLNPKSPCKYTDRVGITQYKIPEIIFGTRWVFWPRPDDYGHMAISLGVLSRIAEKRVVFGRAPRRSKNNK